MSTPVKELPVLKRFNALFGEMPAPQPPSLLAHFAGTAVLAASVLMAYFWPVGPWA